MGISTRLLPERGLPASLVSLQPDYRGSAGLPWLSRYNDSENAARARHFGHGIGKVGVLFELLLILVMICSNYPNVVLLEMLESLGYLLIRGLVWVAAVSSTVCGGLAYAQVSTAEQAVGLAGMMASPTNHENTFEYVRASATARDYEAAIAALERILAYNPGLTRAKYELGALYFKLGSYPMAVHYLEDALNDANIDSGLLRRIEAILPEARKQLSPSRWSGVLFAGVRYNSNPAGAPDNGLVRWRGADVGARGAFGSSPDLSLAFMGEITHVYDFQTERTFVWETTLAGYGALQMRQSNLNLGLFEISSGPRIGLSSDGLPGATIHPYVVGGSSGIGGITYASTIGGGISLTAPVAPSLALTPGIDVRRASVNNGGPFGALGTINSGALMTASLDARWRPVDRLTFNGRVFYTRNSADNAIQSSGETGVGASVKYDFTPPSDQIGLDWSVTVFVRYADIQFDQRNIAIDPVIRRHDGQTRVGAQLDMPIDATFGVSALVQYTTNASNLSTYRANAWSAMLGPTIRF